MIEHKILVVDDEAAIREMLTTAFTRAGYAAFTAVNGEQALEILKQESIPLMFIDLGLQTMTGFELCERIRQSAGGHHRFRSAGRGRPRLCCAHQYGH